MTLEAKILFSLLAIALGSYLAVLGLPRENKDHCKCEYNLIIIGERTMPFAIESLMGPVGGIIGGALERGGAKDQFEWQKQLMDKQEQGYYRMGQFNKELALQLWQQTNYPAQVEQMRKAGLNPGLMYKGAGAGGSTNIAPGSMTSTSGAPRANMGMAIQSALQTAMTAAQIKNIEADTKQKEAQVPKIESEIDLNNAMTKSEGLNQDLKRIKYESDQIALRVQKGGEEAALAEIRAKSKEAVASARSAVVKAEIDEGTEQKVMAGIFAQTTLKYLEVQGARLDLVTKGMQPEQIRAQIDSMQNGIVNSWKELEIKQGQLTVDQHKAITQRIMAELERTMTEFRTATPEQIRQWTSLVSQAVAFTAGLMVK